MLSDHDLGALLQARHHDPFALLGLHADEQGVLWVRALLPGARQVQVLAHTAAWVGGRQGGVG